MRARDLIDPAVPSIAFERHPAAIERHTADLFPRPIPGEPAFAAATTWFPVWAFEPGETVGPELALEPALDPQPEPPQPLAPPAAAPVAAPIPTPVVDRLQPELVPQLPETEDATAARWQADAEAAGLPPSPASDAITSPELPRPSIPTPPPIPFPAAALPAAPAWEPPAWEPPVLEPPGLEPHVVAPQSVAFDPSYDAVPSEEAWEPARAVDLVQTPLPVEASRSEEDLLWPVMPELRRPLVDDRSATDGFWVTDPDADEQQRSVRPPARLQPRVRQAALAGIGLAVLAGLIFAAIELFPAVLGVGHTETAVFNAPMMVVRSAATGRVLTVAANAGQIVEPKSRLFTIQSNDANNSDRVVLAGVHGVIRSVETVPGADLATGAPLVRLQDCDRAFLTIPAGSKLQQGEAVRVKLPDLAAVVGTVRAASGIMEPPNTLVVGLPPGTMISACPVGASAVITPAAQS